LNRLKNESGGDDATPLLHGSAAHKSTVMDSSPGPSRESGTPHPASGQPELGVPILPSWCGEGIILSATNL
jgi:hypothetical protein